MRRAPRIQTRILVRAPGDWLKAMHAIADVPVIANDFQVGFILELLESTDSPNLPPEPPMIVCFEHTQIDEKREKVRSESYKTSKFGAFGVALVTLR